MLGLPTNVKFVSVWTTIIDSTASPMVWGHTTRLMLYPGLPDYPLSLLFLPSLHWAAANWRRHLKDASPRRLWPHFMERYISWSNLFEGAWQCEIANNSPLCMISKANKCVIVTTILRTLDWIVSTRNAIRSCLWKADRASWCVQMKW